MSVLPLILCLVWLSPPVGAMNPASDTTSHIPVVLRFAGDVLLAAHYESEMGDSCRATFRALYRLGGADATVVNLESPITTRGAKIPKPYNFRMNPKLLGVLTGGGIDIVSIANNHIYDYGPKGLLDTISYLDSVGVRHVGAGRTAREAHAAVIDTIRGRRIGFLAYYGGGEAPGAGRSSPGVARRELGGVCADIAALRRVDVSCYIVVILHWGTEKATRPDGGQIAFAHALIDSGADAVVGHHPHVLQGIERYRGGVIAYSLGNFIFGGSDRSSYDTGVLEIRLDRGGPQYAFIPVRIDGWRASALPGADSLRSIESMRRLSSGFHRSIFN